MIEQAKLITMTIVLTMLIWASADSLVNESVVIRVRMEVAPLADPNMIVEIDPEAKARLYEVGVTGARRAVEAVQQREPLVVRLRVDNRETGKTTLTLDKETLKAAMAEQWAEFRRLGVISVSPDELPIVVDHLVRVEVGLTLKTLSLAYESPPQLSRSAVSVRMRESRHIELRRAGQPPELDISSEFERLMRARPAGQRVAVAVALDSRLFGPEAELSPANVEVTATLQSQRMTADIPAVPIKPVVSFANLGNTYNAIARDGTKLTLVTKTIRVSGPTEDVIRLVRGETRAYGFIQLKEADLQQLDVFRAWTPEFLLPPNISLDQVPEPIEFKLMTSEGADQGPS